MTWPGGEEASAPQDGRPDAPTTAELSGGASAPRPATDPGSPEIVAFRSMRGSDPNDLSSASVSLIVDAYERLGGRVLTRLRDLRVDVDADLSELRSEMASLRTAVEDVADRVQLRQMRSSIDELRSDMAGLRRAVLEWPELERVATDVSALRAATTELQQAVSAGTGWTSPRLGDGDEHVAGAIGASLDELGAGLVEVREALENVSGPSDASPAAGEVLRMFSAINVGMARLSDAAQLSAGSGPSGLGGIEERLAPAIDEISARLAALQNAVEEAAPAGAIDGVQAQLTQLHASMVERDQSDPLGLPPAELEELRVEMVALRRRIALRASGTGASLGEADLEAIANVVTERLLQVIQPQ